AGVPIVGTPPDSIAMAEDRKLFAVMLDRLGLRQTPNGSAVSIEQAVAIANRIGYPVLIRPSFVLGGRGMELVYNETDLRRYVAAAIDLGSARVPHAVSDILSDTWEEPPQNAEPTAPDVRA